MSTTSRMVSPKRRAPAGPALDLQINYFSNWLGVRGLRRPLAHGVLGGCLGAESLARPARARNVSGSARRCRRSRTQLCRRDRARSTQSEPGCCRATRGRSRHCTRGAFEELSPKAVASDSRLGGRSATLIPRRSHSDREFLRSASHPIPVAPAPGTRTAIASNPQVETPRNVWGGPWAAISVHSVDYYSSVSTPPGAAPSGARNGSSSL